MSNECPNLLKVQGAEDNLSLFHERMPRIDGNGRSSPFRNFIPIPVELESRTDFNWRKWCNENWGDKWDPPNLGECEHNPPMRIDKGLYRQEYRFITAWNPPLKWLEKASEQSPGLRLELYYFEAGIGFAGISAYQDGECCRETYARRNELEYQLIGSQYFPEEYIQWNDTNLSKYL